MKLPVLPPAILTAALLLLGLLPTSRDSAAALEEKPPDDIYAKLFDQSAGVIRDALKDKPDKRSADKAYTAAILIAACAQRNLDAGPERLAVRDAALSAADHIKKKDYAQAVKLIDSLPTLKGDPNAKKAKVPLVGPRIDLEDLMNQFRPPKVGGLGIEVRFDDLNANLDEVVLPKNLNEQLLRDAYLSIVTAELTAEHKPKEKPEEWRKLSQGMRDHSLALAKAVEAKDGKASYQALRQLNRTCDKCHRVFRNK